MWHHLEIEPCRSNQVIWSHTGVAWVLNVVRLVALMQRTQRCTQRGESTSHTGVGERKAMGIHKCGRQALWLSNYKPQNSSLPATSGIEQEARQHSPLEPSGRTWLGISKTFRAVSRSLGISSFQNSEWKHFCWLCYGSPGEQIQYQWRVDERGHWDDLRTNPEVSAAMNISKHVQFPGLA